MLGTVYAPVIDMLYWGVAGTGAFKLSAGISDIKLPVRKDKTTVFTIVASKSHINRETGQFIESMKTAHKKIAYISRGSSLKLYMVAEGSADIYPRLAPTMKWDTAAAQAVVEAAGGRVLQYGTVMPVIYNKENLLNPWFVVSQ